VALIVSNAELLSDDLGHAAACPDLATKTVGLRPMRKEVRNQPKLLRFKLRMAAVGQMRQQCRTSLAASPSDPTTDRTIPDTESNSNVSLLPAGLLQMPGTYPTPLPPVTWLETTTFHALL